MLLKLKFSKSLTFALLLVQLFSKSDAWGQGDFFGDNVLKTVKIGPHPIYTRILVDLNRPVKYQVNADFPKKQIVLTLPDTEKGPRVRSKAFNDKNLEQFTISSKKGKVNINFVLKKSNTRFFHSMNPEKPQIIIDLKGNTKPIVKTKISGIPPSKKKNKGLHKKRIRIVGYTPKKIQELVSKDKQDKIENGWEDYQKALKTFQNRKYPAASEALNEFSKKFPESNLLGDALYLRAEAEYRKALRQIEPNDGALASFQLAMRKDPKSKFFDHALLKLATIYDDIGYKLEARTLYNQGIKRKKQSIYNEARENNLVAMLVKEDRVEEALDKFQVMLKKSPENSIAKAGILKIANHFFKKTDYDQALEIYKGAAKLWPSEFNKKPEINYNMGEIYFSQEKYVKARKYYFNFLNLDPTSKNAHKALNRAGETYMLEGNYQNALAVFDESSKKQIPKLDEEGKPVLDKKESSKKQVAKLDDEKENIILEDSAETQYGKIRMADIGIRSPRLKVNDIVFDVSYYYKPFQTYEKISKEAKNVEILAEVTLSRGIAYLLEQNNLKAIEEFKKLFPLGPNSRFYQEAERFVKQALIALIDKYSKQKGMLPILYSYSDFVSLPIENIKNAKTLLQVGEAYQAIGMHPEAVKFYEKVKLLDSQKTYRDRIFLNLGKIHIEEKNYNEAIMVGRSFIKNFPRSKRLNEAKKLLAQAQEGNGNLRDAIAKYEELLGLVNNKAEIHYLIAEIKSKMGKYAEAAISYQNAIAEYDRRERVVADYIQKSYYHLGTSLFKINRFNAAIEAFNSAKELFPEHPLKEWADYLLVESYEQQGDLEKSKEGINSLVKAKNTDPILKRAVESSENIQKWEKQLKEG